MADRFGQRSTLRPRSLAALRAGGRSKRVLTPISPPEGGAGQSRAGEHGFHANDKVWPVRDRKAFCWAVSGTFPTLQSRDFPFRKKYLSDSVLL